MVETLVQAAGMQGSSQCMAVYWNLSLACSACSWIGSDTMPFETNGRFMLRSNPSGLHGTPCAGFLGTVSMSSWILSLSWLNTCGQVQKSEWLIGDVHFSTPSQTCREHIKLAAPPAPYLCLPCVASRRVLATKKEL